MLEMWAVTQWSALLSARRSVGDNSEVWSLPPILETKISLRKKTMLHDHFGTLNTFSFVVVIFEESH